MSLQVLHAHTGERFQADSVALSSLEAFKAWLADLSSISQNDQILLTPSGKQVKLQALQNEDEIFLYNRQLISPNSRNSSKDPITSLKSVNPPDIPQFPDSISDQDDLKSWQRLFQARKDWANSVVDKSVSLVDLIQAHFDAVQVIYHGVGVAAGNLQSHIKSLEARCSEAQEWSRQVFQDQEGMLNSLKITTSQMQYLPAKKRFLSFLPKLVSEDEVPKRRSSLTDSTLDSFTQPDVIKSAVATIEQARRSVVARVGKAEASVKEVVSEASDLVSGMEKTQRQSMVDSNKEASQLLEEIRVVAKKVLTDNEHVMGQTQSSKAVSQASKMALLHTRNYLPSLQEYYAEMAALLENVTKQWRSTMPEALNQMQSIARIESSYAQVNSQLMALDMSTEVESAFEYISILAQLPFVYGALLIEAVRRHEWSERLKEESSTLAEDIAGYREEEDRRRKKWLKNIGHLISEDAARGEVLNFELNLGAGESQWPEVSRDDISEYLRALRELDGVEEIIEELSEAAKDLDRPTKRQVKRAKGFKMGSMHEANNVKGSFLLRDNDEIKILRDVNSKLEDDLKSQKSRVRRLEDLVYKQSSNSRPASGNFLQGSEPSSPKHESRISRNPSSSSRRTSTNAKTDDKTLARRITDLEAELYEERQKRQSLETEKASLEQEHSKIRTQHEETRSTKQDLMENMDAQQREFANERLILQEEVTEHRMKTEELEDEIDRLLSEKDTDKRKNDQERATLRQESLEHKENTDEYRQYVAEACKTAYKICNNLSSESPTSEKLLDLLEELEEQAEITSQQVRDLNQNLSAVRAEKKSIQSTLQRQDEENSRSKNRIQGLEDEIARIRNETSSEKARSSSLLAELQDGRSQLRTLRAKFAEGETGSEALRLRVEEQSHRASTLAQELTQSKSHVNSLDVELSSLQRTHARLETEYATTSKRLESRSHRDRELTNRLVETQQELARLLDALGLSIIIRDGAIAIERTSKLMNASQSQLTIKDKEQSGASTVPFPAQPYDPSPDPKLSSWMTSASVEEEDHLFNLFTSKLSQFHLPTLVEAILKLRRDIEWTGKKWKSEARSYRDKCHRLQHSSTSKISFREFKEGDLALFLPTRMQKAGESGDTRRPWAAFNIGAPHYFLREKEGHSLNRREWLVARIQKIEERVVDLSKTMAGSNNAVKDGEMKGREAEDENPFDLSDGLRWYLLDAIEEKPSLASSSINPTASGSGSGPGPTTPGLGKSKSTVASAHVDAKGSIRIQKPMAWKGKGDDASTKLNKSLESRRSSANSQHGSKRGSVSSVPGVITGHKDGTHEEESGGVRRETSTATLPRPSSRSSVNTNVRPPSLAVDVSSPSSVTSNAATMGLPSARPSSGHGQGHGPSGLGIEIHKASDPTSTTEEGTSLSTEPKLEYFVGRNDYERVGGDDGRRMEDEDKKVSLSPSALSSKYSSARSTQPTARPLLLGLFDSPSKSTSKWLDSTGSNTEPNEEVENASKPAKPSTMERRNEQSTQRKELQAEIPRLEKSGSVLATKSAGPSPVKHPKSMSRSKSHIGNTSSSEQQVTGRSQNKRKEKGKEAPWESIFSLDFSIGDP